MLMRLMTSIFRRRRWYRLVLCLVGVGIILQVCTHMLWSNHNTAWISSLPDVMSEMAALRREIDVLRRNASGDMFFKKVVEITQILPDDVQRKQEITVSSVLEMASHPKDKRNIYSRVIIKGNMTCLADGTDLNKTFHGQGSVDECACKIGWYGQHCSVPKIVQAANKNINSFKFRISPRKIVVSFLYNNEYAMLLHRLMDTGDLVDAFLVTEGTYTGLGDRRNLSLFQDLKDSCPEDIMNKVVLDVMDYFPAKARDDGWLFESEARDHVLRKGIPPQILNMSNDEDIFMHTDADEVPSRETLLFLKFHDNIPEPYELNLKKTVYGFFWYAGEWHMNAGATFRMMRDVYRMRPNLLRQKRYLDEKRQLVRNYIKNVTGAELGPLMIVTATYPAGFH